MVKVDATFGDFVETEGFYAKHGVDWRLDDLVIAAQMRRLRVDEVYSNDADFDAIPGVKRVFE